MIAYSSVSHMALILSILSFFRSWGVLGLLLLSLGHGFVRRSLFAGFNMFYSVSGSRRVILKTGFNLVRGLIIFLWLGICATKCSLPPSLNIFAEVSIFQNAVTYRILFAFMLVGGVFITGLFSLNLYIRLVHGPVKQFYTTSFFKFRDGLTPLLKLICVCVFPGFLGFIYF